MAHLIDKDALVAEIEKLKKSHDNWSCMGKCFHQEYEKLLSFLDTLEVKEVDFEAEWKKYFEYRGEVATVNVKHLAKHFYELGLKAQKGE